MPGIDSLFGGCTVTSTTEEGEVMLPLIEEKMQRNRCSSDTSTRTGSTTSSQAEPKRRQIRPGGLAYEYDEADACRLQ
eukprot:symbB.v1.2.037580.t1/scaffold5592.1/size25535/2